MKTSWMGPNRPSVCLVGVGVVGRAILRAHIAADVAVTVLDSDPAAVRASIVELKLPPLAWVVSDVKQVTNKLYGVDLSRGPLAAASERPIVIESIAERLEVKQEFFAAAQDEFGPEAVYCSNTSNLRIGAISQGLALPDRVCGMHFFMPVDQRPAVEVVRASATSQATVNVAKQHARRINKTPLVVGDSPGFVVNRLLSPYLNEAMLMLGRGVSGDQIERAALAFGMPISPLELVDWIGARTMFDAGRAFWQAYPSRINPSPILSVLVKKNRSGRMSGGGFYDYDQSGVRSARLSPIIEELLADYQRDSVNVDDNAIMHALSIPMWIEAALALRDGVCEEVATIDQAMRGGLGFDAGKSWLGFFDALGSRSIIKAIEQWSPMSNAMKSPKRLLELLGTESPTHALESFASETNAANEPPA